MSHKTESSERWALHDLVVAYATAVDTQDWERFESLFVPDARIDYRSAGGIAGTPSEVAAWMPNALSVFAWTMHSVSTHDVSIDGDTASGTLHVVATHGVEYEGNKEIMTVGGIYLDGYVRTDEGWRFGSRTERTHYFDGGEFARLAENAARTASN